MYFLDDIKIIDTEVSAGLSLPTPQPIFSKDELMVFYKGHIFVPSKEQDPGAMIKIYTMEFGLAERDLPKKQEEEYFANHSKRIETLKENFLERAVNGLSVPEEGEAMGVLGPQIGNDLTEKITQEYSQYTQKAAHDSAGGGLITKADDGSVFGKYMHECKRALALEGRLYQLATIPEYISLFQSSFQPAFFSDAMDMAKTATPKVVSEYLSANSDKVNRKALPLVRNKIWYSERSFEIRLDGRYWVPQMLTSMDSIIDKYGKLLERRLKLDASKEYA